MAHAVQGTYGGKHIAKLDGLEDLLNSHEFRALTAQLPQVTVERESPSSLIVASGAARVLVIPCPEHEAPDPRPRLKATSGEITYADHTVDGMRMAIFGMLMQAQSKAQQ